MAVTYEPIASVTLGSNAATIEFASISGTFTDLIVVINGESTRASIAYDGITFTVNNDTATNYSYTRLLGNGTAASSDRSSTQASGGGLSIVAATGTPPSSVTFQFLSYANTNVYKTVLASAANTTFRVERTVSLWRSTSAITSIKFDLDQGDFKSGTVASLYGIKAA